MRGNKAIWWFSSPYIANLFYMLIMMMPVAVGADLIGSKSVVCV
jgi:hypothetical protein